MSLHDANVPNEGDQKGGLEKPCGCFSRRRMNFHGTLNMGVAQTSRSAQSLVLRVPVIRTFAGDAAI